MLNNEYYLWGAGTFGRRVIEFMKSDLVFKAIIDNDPVKQGTKFHNVPVIDYKVAKKNIPGTKIVVALSDPAEVRNFLLGEGFVENRDFYSTYDFIPRYYMEKGKLVPKTINLIVTTMCNMKCEGCQAYIPIAVNKKHISAETVISDVDLMFSHIDSVMNINFCAGEVLLNKEIPRIYSYIHENYAGRYYELAVQTNGSIIPSDEAMHCFSKTGTYVSISNYPENAASIKDVIAKCNDYNVNWYYNRQAKRETWFDFGDPREIHETDLEKLRILYNKCWIPGAGVLDGWLYLCTVQTWSHAVAEAGTREPGDVFDLRLPKTDKSREAVYRLISRQPEKGYISHCMRCNGTVPIVDRV